MIFSFSLFSNDNTLQKRMASIKAPQQWHKPNFCQNPEIILTQFGFCPLKRVDYSIKIIKNPCYNLMLISGCEHVPLYQIIKHVTFLHPGCWSFSCCSYHLRCIFKGMAQMEQRQTRTEGERFCCFVGWSLWGRDWILIRAFSLRGFGLMGLRLARVMGGTCRGLMGVKEQGRWEYKGKKTEEGQRRRRRPGINDVMARTWDRY